MHIVEQRKMEH